MSAQSVPKLNAQGWSREAQSVQREALQPGVVEVMREALQPGVVEVMREALQPGVVEVMREGLQPERLQPERLQPERLQPGSQIQEQTLEELSKRSKIPL